MAIRRVSPKTHIEQRAEAPQKKVAKDLSRIVSKVKVAAATATPMHSFQAVPPKEAKHEIKRTKRVFNETKTLLAEIAKKAKGRR